MKDYGSEPKYQVGDTVRIWPALGRPVATVDLINENVFPVEYQLSYYEHGVRYSGTYEGMHLTLVEKRHSWYCNCKTASGTHVSWCNSAPRRK